jgi:muramoyltetrapeptide carboxypeptidase
MKESIRPPYLQKGDSIGICSPARKIPAEDIESAISMIEEQGFFPVMGKNMFNEHHQFSGTDEERAEDLQGFLDDPNIKAVLFARGGYGTMRIIDKLSWTVFEKNPKWLIGYSDITVLHSHVHTQLNIETLHATMPINFGKDAHSTESLFKVATGHATIHEAENEGSVKNRAGTVTAPLIGGNLSLIFALQGSVSDLDTKGKILFLEDIDEYLYHIDRMMISLKRAGKLSNLAGLVIGGMTDMKDNAVEFGQTAEEIIQSHVAEFSYPVCYNFPAGHDHNNYALPLGRAVHLHVEEGSARIEF